MRKGAKHLRRNIGKRRYKRIFVVATEGDKTEPGYLAVLNGLTDEIRIQCVPSKKASSPDKVLLNLKKNLRNNPLKSGDEAWLVIDKDNWTDEQLLNLVQWVAKKDNRGLALSNPCFEFWLLLHYEQGKGISTAKASRMRLKKHIPNYDKGVASNQFPKKLIINAIERARKRDSSVAKGWPEKPGSTMYKLVEKVLGLD